MHSICKDLKIQTYNTVYPAVKLQHASNTTEAEPIESILLEGWRWLETGQCCMLKLPSPQSTTGYWKAEIEAPQP